MNEASSKPTPPTTQPGSACRARTKASPNLWITPGANTAAAIAAATTAVAMAILRICVLWRTPPTRFRAAIGSIAFASREMAGAGMRPESRFGALLSSGARRVLGRPEVVVELPIWTLRPGAQSKIIGPLPYAARRDEEESHRGADTGRARRRLRRHRHEPALRAADGLLRRPPLDPPDRRGRLRRDLARVLVDHGDRVAQVRHVHHARGQRGRGRHHGPHRAGPGRLAARALDEDGARGARHLRGVALLRRRNDHARDLGAVGGGGAERGRAVARIARGADHA